MIRVLKLADFSASNLGKIEIRVVQSPVIVTTENEGSTSISISCATSGATIYYTTDGTTPSKSSTRYSTSFTVESSCDIKAIAVKNGMDNSAIITKYVRVLTKKILTYNLDSEGVLENIYVFNTTLGGYITNQRGGNTTDAWRIEVAIPDNVISVKVKSDYFKNKYVWTFFLLKNGYEWKTTEETRCYAPYVIGGFKHLGGNSIGEDKDMYQTIGEVTNNEYTLSQEQLANVGAILVNGKTSLEVEVTYLG